MGTASAASTSENRRRCTGDFDLTRQKGAPTLDVLPLGRWFLLSLRAGPFRVFNLCLRRQPLKWQSQINVSKEQAPSLGTASAGAVLCRDSNVYRMIGS